MQTDAETITQTSTNIQRHAVSRLELTEFRNHAHTQLEVGQACVVLYGENGAGKTNILEALSLLAPGRGFRRSKLSEMDGAMPWTIFSQAHGAIGDISIGTAREVNAHFPPASGKIKGGGSLNNQSPPSPPVNGGVNSGDRRVVRVDGQSLKSANALSDYLSVLWLTPQSDSVFLEGGTTRRKFLDRLVYGFDPAHAARVNRYELAMRERNRLLANYKYSTPLAGGRGGAVSSSLGNGESPPLTPPASGWGNKNAWLDGIEAQMAEHGSAIAFARQQAAEHINAVMQMSDLSFPKAHLALHGTIEQAVAEGKSATEVEVLYRDLLSISREHDRYSGRTSVGVHRAEFEVTHLGKHMEAAKCSTGEQKAILLAIILAEARAAALWHGRTPVLLLDEVAAHLDPQKRAELYKEIQSLNVQVWMSGVSCDLFKEMHDNCMFFRVEQGEIFEG